MEKTPLTRFRFPHFAAAALSFLAAMLLAGYILLPLAAERVILPLVSQAFGFQVENVPVRRAGIFGIDLGPLRIGPEVAPGISIVSLSANFTPGDLLQRRVSRVTLQGVKILVREDQSGGFEIPGWFRTPADADDGEVKPRERFPVAFAGIDIRPGEIVIQRGDHHLRLPFTATIRPESGMTAFEGVLKLAVPDRWMTVHARVDLAENHLSADWEGRGLRLGLLANLAGMGKDFFWLSGTGHSSGRVQGQLFPFQTAAVEMKFRHTPCQLNWGDMRLDLSGATPSEDMWVTIMRQNTSDWEVETSPVRVAMPGAEGLFALAGSLEPTAARGMAWQGRLSSLIAVDFGESGWPQVALSLALQTTATLSADGRWRASVTHSDKDSPDEAIVFDRRQGATHLAVTTFEASAEGHQESFEMDMRWQLPAFTVVDDDLQLSFEAATGAGHYYQADDAADGTITTTLGLVTGRIGDLTARLLKVQIAGEGESRPAAPFHFAGEISTKGGAVAYKGVPLKGAGLSARLPLVWPPPEKGKQGSFSLASAKWGEKVLGSVTGRLRQTKEGVAIQIDHDSGFVPGLKVMANGSAGWTPDAGGPFVQLSWKADRPAEAPALIVTDLMPEPPAIPITFSGRLFAEGEMVYNHQLSASLTAGVEEGRLQVDREGMVVEGIETVVHITDLEQMRSAPGQTLRFDALSFGSIRAEDGQLAYQIEPGHVIFLEGGRFRWCGGTVITPATRFVPGVHQYDVAIYCDRLRLDQLLEQFGLAQVEGGGGISGLIPVVLADGVLTFNNAFLYSTPGERSVIRVQGSEVLTAGIPPGTPQYNQMELARHALKDYDYEWVKVMLNTVAEDLLVQLQFDGKPAEPLPFVYDPEAGGFVKTAPGQPGSVFQGIRLDVNVTLPLNRMLRYRELFNRVQ